MVLDDIAGNSSGTYSRVVPSPLMTAVGITRSPHLIFSFTDSAVPI
ncbi:MAG: hypothetical protein U9O65_00250 [Thermotogota bacterium]|nr:hypothetical protein [Thermotogota bacterium]